MIHSSELKLGRTITSAGARLASTVTGAVSPLPWYMLIAALFVLSIQCLATAQSQQPDATQQQSNQQKVPPVDVSPAGNKDGQTAGANQQSQTPIQQADELKSKLTFGIYATVDGAEYDLNMRHQFGPVVTWIAGFFDPQSTTYQARFGVEYDYKNKWLLMKPSLEVGSNGGLIGYWYNELGTTNYAILGISRTNNIPLQDLYFDPNDSLELGVGRKINDYDRLYLETVFDIRFGTGQQNTHLVWRHRIDRKNGITIEALFKSGHMDDGVYIRAFGIGVYYDRPSWFWKLYYDPHVNYTPQTMVRFGIGLKF